MSTEFKHTDLDTMTITQKQKLLDDLLAERKKRIAEHIKPAVDQYIKPIQKSHIKPLKDKHIRQIDNLTRIIRRKLPEKLYTTGPCPHCGKVSPPVPKATITSRIKEANHY